MTAATTSYWNDLTERFGESWNKFWFTPASVVPLCGLRVLVGIAAFYFVLSHSADLTDWFGPSGLLPVETVKAMAGDANAAGGAIGDFHWSYLNLVRTPVELWVVHVLGLIAIGLFVAGVWSRVTSVVSLIVVLSYVHRAPVLTGQFEAVLSMLLAYLCLAPTGAWGSVDAWLKRRAADKDGVRLPGDGKPEATVMANISLRLLQLHVAALYAIFALTKLSGTFGVEYAATWWRGDAMWWLITRSESRMIDLTFLNGQMGEYFTNAWTHAIVALELAFAALIWNRLARPLLLILAAVSWLTLAPVTGLVSYCLIMLVANLVFVSDSTWRRWTKLEA